MKHLIHQTKYVTRRVLSFSLACVMAFALVPAFTTEAGADFVINDKASGEAYNLMTVYRWHRVHTQSDLPPYWNNQEGKKQADYKVPMLLLWDGNYSGTSKHAIFYMYQDKSGTGSYEYDDEDAVKGKEFDQKSGFYPDPFNTAKENDIFYTAENITNISMMLNSGVDGSNQKARYGKIWINDWILKGDGDFDWGGYQSWDGSYTNWTFYTKELNGSYAGNLTDQRPVKILYSRSGWYDTGFYHGNEYCYGHESSTHNYGTFALYWGEKVTVSAITADYTIRSGMVMNVDNGVIIKDGVTVTVMPGGVLSVEGQLYNNGTIRNYGTVIIQPNSCITSFQPKKEDSGKIINSGELVDARKDAQLQLKVKEAELEKLKQDIKDCGIVIEEQEDILAEATKKKTELLNAVDAENNEKLSITLDRLWGQVEAKEQEAAQYDERYDELTEKETLTVEEKKELEEIEAVRTELENLKAAYDELYAPVKACDDQINLSDGLIKSSQQFIEDNQLPLEKLEKLVAEIRKTAESKTTEPVQGEGNLIVMENARLVLNPNSNSALEIKDGGSCVCNGYIVSPAEITLDDAKLHIRSEGAVISQQKFTKNILNVSQLEAQNTKTLDVTFNGLSECGEMSSYAVYASGDYVIRVDGVFSCVNDLVYNIDTGKAEAKIKGSGKCSNATPSNDEESHRTPTGDVVIPKSDGSTYVKHPDGTAEQTWPNGDYIKWFADGNYESMKITGDGYIRTYDRSLKAIVTVYDPVLADGTAREEEYDNGLRNYYDINGKLLYQVI